MGGFQGIFAPKSPLRLLFKGETRLIAPLFFLSKTHVNNLAYPAGELNIHQAASQLWTCLLEDRSTK